MRSRSLFYAAPASLNALRHLLHDPDLSLTDFRLVLKTVYCFVDGFGFDVAARLHDRFC